MNPNQYHFDFITILVIIGALFLPTALSDGAGAQASEYLSPDGTYSYTTWGAGTQAQPYGSTVYAVESDTEVLYVQAALEGFPVRAIESMGGCSAETIVVPSTVESVADGAFDGCTRMKSLVFLGDRPDGAIPSGASVSYLEGASGWGSESALPLKVLFGDGFSFSYYEIDGEATVRALVSGTDVSIPSETSDGVPFRAVGDCAFMGSSVESVSIAEGVREIGVRAFYGCYVLTDAPLPSTLEILRDECFRDCLRLTSSGIPDVRFMGFEAFRECKAITEATIPDSVEVLHDGAFYICRAVRTVSIGSGVASIPPRCFGYCDSVSTIEVPSGVTEIGWSAFYSCISLEEINLENIRTLGDDAFYGCYMMGSTGDMDSIVSIGDRAFSGCRSLESMTLSGSLESLGREAFDGCRSLESLRFLGDKPEMGDNAIPSDTKVICLSSHERSWSGYDGNLVVEGDGSGQGSSSIVLAAAIAIIVAVSCIALAVWTRGRRSC